MQANKGEAERCLREANKWQNANRPVKALKFAKKSHRLFPTPEAQRKVGELTDIMQQRQANYPNNQQPQSPPDYDINNNRNRNVNNNTYQRRNANNNNNNNNNQSSSQNAQNQDFVEIDPNLNDNNNNNHSSTSFLSNMLSIEFWSMLMESVYGQIFGRMHVLLSPILPATLRNFSLRYRGKIWLLLSIVLLLFFTRFIGIKSPFNGYSINNNTNKSYKQQLEDDYNDKYAYSPPLKPQQNKPKYKSEKERLEEEYKRKYGSGHSQSHSQSHPQQKKPKYKTEKERLEAEYNRKYNRNNRNRRNSYDEYDNYDNYGGYGGSGQTNRNNRHNSYGNNGYYNSYSSYTGGMSMFNMIFIGLIFVPMILNMCRRNNNNNGNGVGDGANNNNNGVNWNMMMFLPMLFGGMPFGGGMRFGRRRFRRRGWF